MEDKNITTRIVIIAAVIIIVGLGFLGIWNYNPYYNDTVYDYSDNAPRVGNNLYGFIDVPDGFVLKGSFDGNNEDYAGGKDGISDGVRLVDPKGNACITISLITPDRRQKDYIGLGFEDYYLCKKKKRKVTSDTIDDYLNSLIYDGSYNIHSIQNFVSMEDGADTHGGWVNINNLSGYYDIYYTKKDKKTFHNQLYFFTDSIYKNMIHSICFTYQVGYEECRDCINTYSLSRQSSTMNRLADSGKRDGDPKTGYINLPSGYEKWDTVKTNIFEEMLGKIVDVGDEKYEEADEFGAFVDTNSDDYIFIYRMEKNAEFTQNESAYMDHNFSGVFGHFGLLDFIDSHKLRMGPANLNIQMDNSYKEFNAETFESVMQINLREHGTYDSSPITIDGNSGYRIKWNGRKMFTDENKEFILYILNDANNPDYVYAIGANTNSNAESLEPFLKSFSTDK